MSIFGSSLLYAPSLNSVLFKYYKIQYSYIYIIQEIIMTKYCWKMGVCPKCLNYKLIRSKIRGKAFVIQKYKYKQFVLQYIREIILNSSLIFFYFEKM